MSIPILEVDAEVNNIKFTKDNTLITFIDTFNNKDPEYINSNNGKDYICLFLFGTKNSNLKYYENLDKNYKKDINNTKLVFFIHFDNKNDVDGNTKIENTILILKNSFNGNNFKSEKIINKGSDYILIFKENTILVSPHFSFENKDNFLNELKKYKYEFVITNCLNENDNCINIIYHTFYLNSETYKLYKKYLKQMKYLKYKLKYLLLKKINN